jgi:hypothetical protein
MNDKALAVIHIGTPATCLTLLPAFSSACLPAATTQKAQSPDFDEALDLVRDLT